MAGLLDEMAAKDQKLERIQLWPDNIVPEAPSFRWVFNQPDGTPCGSTLLTEWDIRVNLSNYAEQEVMYWLLHSLMRV